MPAPNLVGSPYTATFTSNTNPWTVSLPNGLTAGNTVVVIAIEYSSTYRDLSSCDDGVNTYGNLSTGGIVNSSSSPQAHVLILKKENIASVAAGSTLTLQLTGVSTGQLIVLELDQQATEATAYWDAVIEGTTASTTAFCGSSNFTIPANCLAISALATSGTGTISGSSGWTQVSATLARTYAQVLQTSSPTATLNAPHTLSIARLYAGGIAVFAAAAASPTLAQIEHAAGRGSFRGMMRGLR